MKAAAGENTKTADLGGKFMMPGLVDTHTHPFVSSFDLLNNFTLDPVPESLEDIQEQLILFAYDPVEKKAIEVLRVSEKQAKSN